MKQFRIKKGDKVVVISGKDKGKTGKVLSLVPEKSRILVSGINIIKKHQKRTKKDEKGSILHKEASIHYSNVLLYSEKLKKGFRMSIKKDDKKKLRFCRETKEEF